MTKFLLWHKCDFAWIDKEYCSQICADKKTQVLDLHGRRE